MAYVTGREQFQKNRWLICFLYHIILLIPRFLRKKLLLFFRNIEGRKGFLARYLLVKSLAKRCGDNVAIYPNVFLFHVDEFSVGDNVSIHHMSYLDCLGGLEIGSNVSIAHGVSILPYSHKYDSPDIPIKYQGIIKKMIKIEDNVWIGAKVTILCGRVIGSGAVIGAGTVVTKDVPQNTVAAGVPIKIIREKRF